MAREDVLEKLFGSAAKARLLRLFSVNPDELFDHKKLASRLRMKAGAFKKDLATLLAIGFVRRSSRVVSVTNAKTKKMKRIKISGYLLARDFPYVREIIALLASGTPHTREKLMRGLKSVGKPTLVVISGCLIGSETQNADVFIVGDELKKTKIERVLKQLETDIGKEITYALMPTREFEYRYGMYDRFIRDLFDNPHEVILDRLGARDGGSLVRITQWADSKSL